jgi:hypothetical protein
VKLAKLSRRLCRHNWSVARRCRPMTITMGVADPIDRAPVLIAV